MHFCTIFDLQISSNYAIIFQNFIIFLLFANYTIFMCHECCQFCCNISMLMFFVIWSVIIVVFFVFLDIYRVHKTNFHVLCFIRMDE